MMATEPPRTPPLPPLSEAELLEEVAVRPRDALVPLPDLRRVARPGWVQVITPSFKQGGFNEVAHAELAEAEADAVIDATIAEYRALGCRFRWAVGPGSAPADLAARLAARGLAESWTLGMARSTAPLPPASEGAGAGGGAAAAAVAELVTADDPAALEAYTAAMAEGWGVDPAPLRLANALALAGTGGRHRLFLARVGGEPAGTAAYVAFERSAYLLGAVTLPRLRGRGVYRALVEARLADARARGLPLATSHARETTSAPILARLGFATICRFPVYHL